MKILLVHTPFNWKRPLTLIAYLIRKVTGTYWNHCAVLIELNNYFFVVESDIKGVTITPYKNWVKEQTIKIYRVPDTDVLKSKVLSKCGKVGYSFKDLFWFMPIYLFTGQFYGQKVDGFSNKPTCYEYVAWVLGLTSWYKMTPNTFEKFANNLYQHEATIKATDYKL